MREEEAVGAGATFSLTSDEQALGGIRWRNGRLQLRPSRGARTLSALTWAFGALVATVGFVGRDPIFAAVGLGQVLFSSLHLRCRVEAAEGRIRVVNKWRRIDLPANEVTYVVTTRFRPDMGFFPFAGPFTWWPRSFETAMIQQERGRPVRCDAVVCIAKREGDAQPTPAELKVATLQRWVFGEGAR